MIDVPDTLCPQCEHVHGAFLHCETYAVIREAAERAAAKKPLCRGCAALTGTLDTLRAEITVTITERDQLRAEIDRWRQATGADTAMLAAMNLEILRRTKEEG